MHTFCAYSGYLKMLGMIELGLRQEVYILMEEWLFWGNYIGSAWCQHVVVNVCCHTIFWRCSHEGIQKASIWSSRSNYKWPSIWGIGLM